MKKSLHVLLWFLICLLASCTSQLHDAARDGDIKTARELLRQGTDIHLRDSNGATPLHLAAGRGNNQMVRFLLEQGADVNAVPKGGSLGGIWEYPLFTPLADAAYHGHYDTINLLLDNGANVDIAMQALSRNNSAGARSGVALLASIEQKRAGKRTQAAQRYSEGASISESPPSDIDRLPLLQVKQSRLAYAIVVGIEKYRQKLPKASFASRDARLVYEYLTQTMGYPKQNVVMLDDEHAALGDLIKYFEKWLPNNVEKGGRVFIYYSGHGAPNPQTGDSYLVPYDGDPSFIEETGYSLKRLYDVLGKLQAGEVVVALDSCFSGAGGRSVLAKGARPLVMNLRNNMPLSGNITILAASSGGQISSTYEEKGHGLFTYFMLKGIKNEGVLRPDGSVKINDLFDYLKPQVEHIARKQYNNEQTPQLIIPNKN